MASGSESIGGGSTIHNSTAASRRGNDMLPWSRGEGAAPF